MVFLCDHLEERLLHLKTNIKGRRCNRLLRLLQHRLPFRQNENLCEYSFVILDTYVAVSGKENDYIQYVTDFRDL